MFYVAMTRAKQFLHLYWVKERYNKELKVSRFISELYVDQSDLVKGAHIIHKNYGDGVIVDVSNGKMTVKFEKQRDEKFLDIKYCLGNQLIKIKE